MNRELPGAARGAEGGEKYMQKNRKKLFCVALLLAVLFLSGAFIRLHAEDFQPEQSRIKVNAVFIPQTVYELNRLKGRSAELQHWIGAKADKGILEWAYSEEKNRLVPKNWIFMIENNGLVIGLIATDPVTDDFSWRTTWDINRHIQNIRAIFSFQPMSIESESISALNLRSPSDYDFQKTKLVIIRGRHNWIVPKKGDTLANFLIAPIEALNKIRAFKDFQKDLRPTGMVSVGEDPLSPLSIQSDLGTIMFTPSDRFLMKSESGVTVQAADTEMVGEVPIYDQGSTSNCWAYSLAMVHQWWSPINLGTGDYQVHEIRDYIGLGPDDGAALDTQHQIMENWPSVDGRFEDFPRTGYGEGQAFAVRDPTWNGTDPKTWLTFEAPVLAAIDSDGGGPDSDVNHMVVITGYDDAAQAVYINNPWGFADTFSYSVFNQKYWGAIWESRPWPFDDKRRGMVCGLDGDNDYVNLSTHSVSFPVLEMYDNEKVIVEYIGLSISGDNAGGGWDSFDHYNYLNTFNSSLGWYLEPMHILIDNGVTATPVNLGNWWASRPVPPAWTIEFSEQDLAPGESLYNASFYVKVDPSGRSDQMRVFYSWTVWDHNDRTHYQAGRVQVFHDGVVRDGNMMMLTPMRIRATESGYTYIQVYDDDATPPTITNPYSQPESPVDGLYSGDIQLNASASDSQSGIDYVKFIYRYGIGSPVERDGTMAFWPRGQWYCSIPKNEWTQHRGDTIYWKVEAADADNDCAGDGSIGYSQELALVLSPAVIQYSLTISAGEGGTTEPAPGTYSYNSGTDVEVKATPKSGYTFSSWTGDVPTGHETDNPVALAMDSDRSLMGHFSPTGQVDWTPAKRLTWTSGHSYQPRFAVDSSGRLHLAWYDSAPGNFEIYYRKGTDGGASWAANKRLTWTSGQSSYPSIAAYSSGTVHAVWQDNTAGNHEIYYRKSTDAGTMWTAAKRLTWTAGSSDRPAVAASASGHIHLVWQDDTPGKAEIYYKKSTDGGTTWTSNKRLTSTSGVSKNAAIAVNPSGHILVVWQDNTPGNYEIYYKKSMDGGASWSANQRLTSASGVSQCPAIAVNSSGHIHVVWQDNAAGNDEIFYRKSTNGGASWTASRRITWTSGASSLPALSVNAAGHLQLVWGDGTPGNMEIYYKKSTDGGATWTASQRLTWNSGSSTTGAIASDPSGNLQVFWQDNTPGNYEIYYKRGK